MYTVGVVVGRLVEARLFTLEKVDQVAELEEAMRGAFSRAGNKSVICADWRAANVLAPPVADRLIDLLSKGNPFLERSAVLLAREHATFNLQVERLVRQANNPARKAFRDVAPLQLWLDEILTPAEQVRLREFLSRS
jgi:hypothetical protein